MRESDWSSDVCSSDLIMILWFGSLGALGLIAIFRQPDVLLALNPVYAYEYFAIHRMHGFISLASVVLCITGGEALYADMGHFGRLPIRITWCGIVLPGLVLNYYGQGALLLHDPAIAEVNPFYALAPKAVLYPLVGLATVAAVIASQA
jgi:KUP system potassium uptake protein